jgi:hypothetical protein
MAVSKGKAAATGLQEQVELVMAVGLASLKPLKSQKDILVFFYGFVLLSSMLRADGGL